MIAPTHPTDLVRPASSLGPVWQRQPRNSFSSNSSGDISRDSDNFGVDGSDDDYDFDGETTPTVPDKPIGDCYIVLIDIRKTIQSRKIECVKKLMDEPGLRYCAISYRWGEVPEQTVMTPDYIAHVTSFLLADLELLCGQLLVANGFDDATDGGKKIIDYLWVDAISIDQQNEEARKETIRQMNRIYHHSTLILAVPDLHVGHLKQNPSNRATLAKVRKYSPHIYHHATGACQSQNKQLHRRSHYNQLQRHRPTPVPSSSHQHQGYDFPHIATVIQPSPSSSSSSAAVHTPSESSSSLLTPTTPITPLTPDDDGDGNNQGGMQGDNSNTTTQGQRQQQQRRHHAYETPTCNCFRRKGDSGGVSKSCQEAIKFVNFLVMEWSNRVWVISEYHIGRTKTMRLWFLSFDLQWFYTKHPRFIPLFDCIYRDHFRHRGFLNMILNSRATKNEDRFYAILPLSTHYRKHILSKDTVSQWKIGDQTSVCLRLYDFVSPLEKLAILFCCSKGRSLILPSFASCFYCADDDSTITKILSLDPEGLLIQDISLVAPAHPQPQEPGDDKDKKVSRRHRLLHRRQDLPQQLRGESMYLNIKATSHRRLHKTINKDTRLFWASHESICRQLGWKSAHNHHKRNHLDQVFIPFVESETHTLLGIHLIGDRNINRWVVHPLTIINVSAPVSEWDVVNEVEEFHIY